MNFVSPVQNAGTPCSEAVRSTREGLSFDSALFSFKE
jgi:hypothetical protein